MRQDTKPTPLQTFSLPNNIECNLTLVTKFLVHVSFTTNYIKVGVNGTPNSCLNTKIYSCLVTSGGYNSNLYLIVVYFFNTSVLTLKTAVFLHRCVICNMCNISPYKDQFILVGWYWQTFFIFFSQFILYIKLNPCLCVCVCVSGIEIHTVGPILTKFGMGA